MENNGISEVQVSIPDLKATALELYEKTKEDEQKRFDLDTKNLEDSIQGKKEGEPVNPQTNQEKPKEKDKVDTLGEVVGEVKNAVVRGVSTGVEDVVTLPERLTDMITGEYQREEKTEEGYQAEFNPFSDIEHPLARTWWGSAIETVAHFGTLVTGTVAAAPLAKGVAARVGLGGLTSWVGGNVFAKGAVIGGVADFASRYSEDDNITSMVVKHVPILEPLATKETDHIFVKKFKNVVEGMGIGGVFDYIGVKSGGIKGIAEALERSKNQSKQIVERGKQFIGNGEFNGYKNKKVASPHVGTTTSTGDAHTVHRSLNQADQALSEEGSTDSIFTAAEQLRMSETSGMEGKKIEALRKEFMSDARYAGYREELKQLGKSPEDIFPGAFERMQHVMGRHAAGEEDIWKPITDQLTARTGGEDSLEYWAIENVVAADLINGSLFKELRDQAIASRELFDVANVLDQDGPMQSIAEKLIIGITNTKRSRYVLSNQFSQLRRTNAQRAKKQLVERTAQLHEEAKQSVQMMMDLIGKDDSDELLQAVLEAFSMSNKIQNFQDFDAWMRAKIRGGEFQGKQNTGALVKEIQEVMIHSILSGPKTPLRAILGTSTASFLRPISQGLGYAMRGDSAGFRASMAASNAYIQAIPESWKLFKANLNSYWSGDLSTVKSRYSEYNPNDEQWELFGKWANSSRATDGDRAAFNVANMARSLNDNSFLTYSTKVMAATDDSFRYLMARSRARERAMRQALDAHKIGDITEITPQLLSDYEDNFLKQIIDADGNINPGSDLFLESAAKEATLTTDLSGFAGSLEKTFNQTPWAKPFFLFARTGINGLALTAKNTPGLNYFLKSQRDIFMADPRTVDYGFFSKYYGIENATDLANAKALALGRQAIGGSVIFMVGQDYMKGKITGNGPADRQKRQFMIDSGWVPRSILIGDRWVSYDSLEPFNQILAAVADIGDNMELMGPEWAEMNFLRAAAVVGQGATSKSYMTGLQQLVDLLSGEAYQWQKIGGGILNNTLPLGGLRNEIGKILNPGMRELGSHIGDAIRNRNLAFEYGPGKDLAIKYDMLNGEPIRNWSFPQRMFNAVSPVQLQLKQSPGRTLLFNSAYDLRMSTYTAPDGTNLRDHPHVRSKFQRAIGQQGLEKQLNELAKKKSTIESIAKMEADLKAGRRERDPMKAYNHNRVIKRLFQTAMRKAWASLRDDPEVQILIQERKVMQAANNRSLFETRSNQILNLPSK